MLKNYKYLTITYQVGLSFKIAVVINNIFTNITMFKNRKPLKTLGIPSV